MKFSIAPFGTLALIAVGITIFISTSSTSTNRSEEEPAFANVEAEDGLFSEVHDTVGDYIQEALEWPQTDSHDHRNLQYSDDCIVDGPYFYKVGISVSPGGRTVGKCLRAQQILLGHDLNLLLLRVGLGERNDGDNILSMGGVCPKPNTGYAPRRLLRGEDELDGSFEDELFSDEIFEDELFNVEEMLLEQGVLDDELLQDNNEPAQHRDLGWGFVYKGGFACGWFCSNDDRDARRRKLVIHNCNDPRNWRNCYITQVKRTLAAAIRADIAPKYPACLGTSPSISISMTATNYATVSRLTCGNTAESGEVREFLESFTLSDFYITTENRVTCNSCSTLDFSQKGDGSSVYQQYIHRDTWKESHGVRVTARAAYGDGYTPGNKPRIFDSNKSTSLNRDMRSPNESCPGGGPGRGVGGMQNTNGENCNKLGNLLIVNRFNNNEPQPNPKGGIITFSFDNPVLFSDVGIVDADGSTHRIWFKYSDGTSKTFTYHGFGNNGVQRVICNQGHVVQADIQFRETAGISEINFCEQCTDINDRAKSRTKLIAMEDFEGSSPLSNWYNGRLENGGVHFTKFLGRYANVEKDPFKTYVVPVGATSLTVTMDLYQIDSWDNSDRLDMYVGGQKLNIGALKLKVAAGHFSGISAGNGGITYSAKKLKSGRLFFNSAYTDTIWRLQIIVPGGGNSVYNNGKLFLRWNPILSSNKDNESFGVDNIKIVANDGCAAAKQLFLDDFESSTNGWSQARRDTSSQNSFTKFLGRYGNEGMTPYKTYNVPTNADSISVTFDFYKIDSWDATDKLRMWVDNHLIDFGVLPLAKEGDQTGGSIGKGISWQAVMTGGGQLGFSSGSHPAWKDQIIRIDLQVPRSTGLYSSDGRLQLKFRCDVNENVANESCGFDNIRIASNAYCSEEKFKYVGNTNNQNWAWHESNARNRGCTLASITSEAENDEAVRVCRSMTWGDCIIGGRHRMHWSNSDLNDESKWAQMRDPTGTLWQWSDGRPFIYAKWDTNEPNAYNGWSNVREIQSVIQIVRDGSLGLWHDKEASARDKAVYRCPA